MDRKPFVSLYVPHQLRRRALAGKKRGKAVFKRVGNSRKKVEKRLAR
jgi:hypothetical protein